MDRAAWRADMGANFIGRQLVFVDESNKDERAIYLYLLLPLSQKSILPDGLNVLIRPDQAPSGTIRNFPPLSDFVYSPFSKF